jgi:hypothetical protein
MLASNELEMMWKETVIALLQVLSRISLQELRRTTEIPVRVVTVPGEIQVAKFGTFILETTCSAPRYECEKHMASEILK